MRLVASMLLGALLFLSAPANANEIGGKADLERRELMASKKYEKRCKKFAEQFSHDSENDEYPVDLLCRMLPRYTERCVRSAKPDEAVTLLFDVTPDGFTTNLRLVETTNDCHVEAAASSLLLWKFVSSEDGAKDLKTTIVFQLRGW